MAFFRHGGTATSHREKPVVGWESGEQRSRVERASSSPGGLSFPHATEGFIFVHANRMWIWGSIRGQLAANHLGPTRTTASSVHIRPHLFFHGESGKQPEIDKRTVLRRLAKGLVRDSANRRLGVSKNARDWLLGPLDTRQRSAIVPHCDFSGGLVSASDLEHRQLRMHREGCSKPGCLRNGSSLHESPPMCSSRERDRNEQMRAVHSRAAMTPEATCFSWPRLPVCYWPCCCLCQHRADEKGRVPPLTSIRSSLTPAAVSYSVLCRVNTSVASYYTI